MTSTASRLIPFAFVSVLFSGCSAGRMAPFGVPIAAHVKGGIHGGLQPVSGSTIQLFDATQGGQPLILTTVTSDSNGNFSITGDYTCPASSDQVYLVATGGNPGAGVNDNLVLMTAMGNCGDLTASTFVNVNEVTTVATIYAYAADFNPSPSTPGGYLVLGDSAAYATFLTMVDPASGNGLANGDPASPMKLNSLANTLATCINATSVSGVTQACVDLINMAAPPFGSAMPQDSAVAVYLIAMNPTFGPVGIFNDAASNPPFQPALVAAPVDWTLP